MDWLQPNVCDNIMRYILATRPRNAHTLRYINKVFNTVVSNLFIHIVRDYLCNKNGDSVSPDEIITHMSMIYLGIVVYHQVLPIHIIGKVISPYSRRRHKIKSKDQIIAVSNRSYTTGLYKLIQLQSDFTYSSRIQASCETLLWLLKNYLPELYVLLYMPVMHT